MLEKVAANPTVVAALKEQGFPSTAETAPGRTARVQGRSIQIGDVALFPDGRSEEAVGEIYWFALIDTEFVVRLSTWPVVKTCGRYRKCRVAENFPIIRTARLKQAMIFTPTEVGKVATVILPTL